MSRNKLDEASATVRFPMVAPEGWIAQVDAWRRAQSRIPSRGEAVRMLVERAIGGRPSRGTDATPIKRDLHVTRIDHAVAEPFIEHWHYSGLCPSGYNVFFGAFIAGELYAVAAYGVGSALDKGASLARITGLPVRCSDITQEWLDKVHGPSVDVGGLTVGERNCLEIKRLCRKGGKGTAEIPLTRFLSQCHRILKREDAVRYVVSYSDPGELRTERVDGKWDVVSPTDHGPKQSCGGIYRAANFRHLGSTAKETHAVRESDGTVVHRGNVRKEQGRWNEKNPQAPKSLAEVRAERGLATVSTPAKERWFLAL